MSELSYAQAIDLAQNMRNHYLAFERLRDVLELAATGAGQADTLRHQITDLTAELSTLQGQRVALAQEIAGVATSRDSALRQVEKDAADRKDALEVEFSSRIAELDAAYQNALAAHTERLAALERALEDRRSVLESEYSQTVERRRSEVAALEQEMQQTLDRFRAQTKEVAEALAAKRDELTNLQGAVDSAKEFLNRLRETAGVPLS